MKIFNNRSSGGSGGNSGGSSVEPGDIIMSSVNKTTFDPADPMGINSKWFDLSYSGYLSDYEDTDIPRNQNYSGFEPQLATFKKASILDVANDGQITKLENGAFLYTCFNGSLNQNFNVGVVRKGLSPNVVTIEVADANCYSSVFDYDKTVYVYRNAAMSYDDLMSNTIYKVNIETFEYETITIANKRICSAYYSKSLGKFITHEFNNIDVADQTPSKSGIFISDDFENTSPAATFEALSNNNDFKNKDIFTSIKNMAYKMLYTTDNNFLIYHDTEKQLKKYTNGIASLAIDVLDKNGAKTLVVSQSLVIEYDGNYFVAYNHKLNETENYKAWVRVDTGLLESPEYCFCEQLKSFEFNSGYLLKDVYNRDFENQELPQFGYAVAYQNSMEDKRKVTTFRNSYTYEDVNTINAENNNWMIKKYFIDLNYTAIHNNEEQYIIDNFGTLSQSQPWEGNITNFKFDGFGVPGIYIQSMMPLETIKYFLRIKK